jgi:hypothetical protein
MKENISIGWRLWQSLCIASYVSFYCLNTIASVFSEKFFSSWKPWKYWADLCISCTTRSRPSTRNVLLRPWKRLFFVKYIWNVVFLWDSFSINWKFTVLNSLTKNWYSLCQLPAVNISWLKFYKSERYKQGNIRPNINLIIVIKCLM